MNEKKSEEMQRYENKTGKKAIRREVVTEGFKKWQKGEKLYTFYSYFLILLRIKGLNHFL